MDGDSGLDISNATPRVNYAQLRNYASGSQQKVKLVGEVRCAFLQGCITNSRPLVVPLAEDNVSALLRDPSHFGKDTF